MTIVGVLFQITVLLIAIFVVVGIPVLSSFLFHKFMRVHLRNKTILGLLDLTIMMIVFYLVYLIVDPMAPQAYRECVQLGNCGQDAQPRLK